MARSGYDLVIVGGGLAGAGLATVMAGAGARVVVLEREARFRDRIRGETIHPWGVAEARALGLLQPLLERCAHPVRWWASFMDGAPRPRRDLPATNPHGTGSLDYFHPEMQEALIELAAEAGAEIRRGVIVTGVEPGTEPVVEIENGGRRDLVRGRLVVGADGRSSGVRRWGGFSAHRDREHDRISGLLFEDVPIDEDAVHLFLQSSFGHFAMLFPLGRGRVRAYFSTSRRTEHPPLSGEGDVERFVSLATSCGIPPDWFAGARACGPLATFEGAASWVEHPHRDGIVLVGDAAGTSNPNFGCGQSLTLRDIRVLRDELLADGPWPAAADRYATEHDRHFEAMHRIESWFGRLWFDLGPGADAVREHAFAALAAGSGPDSIGVGPDAAADEAARLRLLGV